MCGRLLQDPGWPYTHLPAILTQVVGLTALILTAIGTTGPRQGFSGADYATSSGIHLELWSEVMEGESSEGLRPGGRQRINSDVASPIGMRRRFPGCAHEVWP